MVGSSLFYVALMFYPLSQCCDIYLFYFGSEWVLGSREDLVKDIIAELQPGHGEVMLHGNFELFLHLMFGLALD